MYNTVQYHQHHTMLIQLVHLDPFYVVYPFHGMTFIPSNTTISTGMYIGIQNGIDPD